MLKTFAVLAGLAVATAPALSAQTDTLTYVGPVQGTTDGHFYVGPYNGVLDHTPITINCVDVFHQVNAGETWAVNISPFTGALSDTRTGNLSLYEQAAYLTTRYGGVTTATDTANIQHAIWRLFASNTNLTNGGLGYMVNSGSDYWLNIANTNYATAGINYGNYEVITPIDPSDPNSGQEYIASVPEPSVIALVGTGLLALVPPLRRRRRRA